MANRYKRSDVLRALCNMMQGVGEEVYTSNRPTVKDTTEKFVVVRLPQGISPESDLHNTAYVQLHLYYKDRVNGIEHVERGEEMTEDAISSIKRDLVKGGAYGDWLRCNEEPVQLEAKSDSMGYHVCVIQFKIVILV